MLSKCCDNYQIGDLSICTIDDRYLTTNFTPLSWPSLKCCRGLFPIYETIKLNIIYLAFERQALCDYFGKDI